MRSLERMIDAATKTCLTKTNVAKALGCTPQRLWDYETGTRHMPVTKVMRLATLANTNAVLELGRYEAEWSGKKTGSATVGIAVAAFSLGALSMAPGADAYPLKISSTSTHYAQLVAWLRRLGRRPSARLILH